MDGGDMDYTPLYVVRLGRAPLLIGDGAFSSATVEEATRFTRIGGAMRAAIMVNGLVGKAVTRVERVGS